MNDVSACSPVLGFWSEWSVAISAYAEYAVAEGDDSLGAATLCWIIRSLCDLYAPVLKGHHGVIR
jgi:hypothetical protein